MGIRDQVSVFSMFTEIRVHPRFWTCSIALYLATLRVLKIDHKLVILYISQPIKNCYPASKQKHEQSY